MMFRTRASPNLTQKRLMLCAFDVGTNDLIVFLSVLIVKIGIVDQDRQGNRAPGNQPAYRHSPAVYRLTTACEE
jgi:hypothetical protein